MSTKTFTAPMAVIKVDGITIGSMKSVRCTENMRRGTVRGIGALTPSELPALEWSGQLSCSSYQFDFNKSGVPALVRKVGSLQDFVDTVLLSENGLTIVLFRKEKDTVDPNTGVITPKLVEHATIQGAFIERESMDLSEGQISGKDQEFQYTTPILFSI